MKKIVLLFVSAVLFIPMIFIVGCEKHIHMESREFNYDNDYHWHQCEDCDYIYEKEFHVASDWIIDYDSTCISEGRKYKECNICHYIIEEQIIERKEHSMTNWIEKSSASCENPQILERHCVTCNTQNETMEGSKALGHMESNWIIDKNSKGIETGIKYKKCLHCGRELYKDNVEYTITFETYTDAIVDNITKKFQENITEPVVILLKQGYDFEGWYYYQDGVEHKFKFTTMPINGAQLHAKWTLHNYQINYHLYSGDNGENLSSFTILSDDILLKDPIKPYNKFDGWYLDETYTKKVELLIMPQYQDIDLYAKYTPVFNTNNDTIIGLTEYGESLTELTIPEILDGIKLLKLAIMLLRVM